MSELRQKMIDAMRQRGYSVRTHKSYICAVADLARYYRRSPDRLSAEEVKSWLRHLAVERGLSGASCRQYSHAARFLYVKVLGREDFELKVDLPKRPQRIPELLTRNEVARILADLQQQREKKTPIDWALTPGTIGSKDGCPLMSPANLNSIYIFVVRLNS